MTLDDLRTNFFSHVEPEPNSGCWLWIGGRSSREGYGRFAPRERVIIAAHVMSWLLHHGPAVGWVLHRCDFPPCVNPAHLFLGDQRANMLDCGAKGRNRSQRPGIQAGERNHRARLTTASVADIRRRFAEGHSRRTISEALKVPRQTVEHIIARRRWAHLPVVEELKRLVGEATGE